MITRVYMQYEGSAPECVFDTDDPDLALEYLYDHVEGSRCETDTGVVYNVYDGPGTPVMWVSP